MVCVSQFSPEFVRRTQPKVNIGGELAGALPGSLTEIALGQRLQAPGYSAKQMSVVRRPGLLAKQLSVARLQRLGLLLSQAFNCFVNFWFHESLSLGSVSALSGVHRTIHERSLAGRIASRERRFLAAEGWAK